MVTKTIGQFAKKTTLTLGLCLAIGFPAFASERTEALELTATKLQEARLTSVLQDKAQRSIARPDMNETQAKARISLDQAKKIALKHAGVSASEATFTKAKLDRDDGRLEYDIEFVANGKKYEYEILASNGRIIKTEVESVNDEGDDD